MDENDRILGLACHATPMPMGDPRAIEAMLGGIVEPLISVVAICKDEAANIQAFLNSWSKVADQIVVLDTGSEDISVGLLSEAADKAPLKIKLGVNPNITPFDFSAARNQAQEMAVSRWILWADLDDRVDEASIETIRELAERTSTDRALAFQVVSLQPNGVNHRFLQVRMYPNHQGLTWSKPVHETLDYSLVANDIAVVRVPEVQIAHLGYSTQAMKEAKAKRNLEILLKIPGRGPVACFEIGESFFVLGRFDEGMVFFAHGLSQDESYTERVAEKMVIGNISLGDLGAAAEWARKMPAGSIGRAFWEGEIAIRQGKPMAALEMYAQALSMSPTVNFAGSTEELLVEKAKDMIHVLTSGGKE